VKIFSHTLEINVETLAVFVYINVVIDLDCLSVAEVFFATHVVDANDGMNTGDKPE